MNARLLCGYIAVIISLSSLSNSYAASDEACDYGITTSITHRLWYMKPAVDIINITVLNIPEENVDSQYIKGIDWWQYSPRYLLLQVNPPYLRLLWFALLSPKIENVRVELPSCALNDTYEELLVHLASGIISALEVDITAITTTGERLCLGSLEERMCCESDHDGGIITYEMKQSNLLVGTGIACVIMALVITVSLLCVGSSNLKDTDWWSLDESQTLHRNASLPLLLSLKPRGWSVQQINKVIKVTLSLLFAGVALVAQLWFLLFTYTMQIVWVNLIFWIPGAIVLGLLVVILITLLQRCFRNYTNLLRIRQAVWVPIVWFLIYLVFWVGSFVVMAMLWMIVGVVVHVNIGFPFFVAIFVIAFSIWHSFYLATERARMAKAMIFDIFESTEGTDIRTKVPLTRHLFIKALESPRVAYGKLALVRAWQRVTTTMALVISVCVALVTMLNFLSDNSLVHSVVTAFILAGVAYIPSLTLQHDKSDFSNSKLRKSLILYLRSLPQMQSDDFPISELLKGVQMDNTTLLEGGNGSRRGSTVGSPSTVPLLNSPTLTPSSPSSSSIDEEALLATSEHTNYRSVV